MSGHPFRFGVVGAATAELDWRATAHNVADLGYTSLLVPDGLHMLSPLPALAYAAACADVTVGSFVLAAPLRPPRSAAWEAHSMSVLTGGRFELGIGTGLPNAASAAADEFGLPALSPAQRLAAVESVIDHVRELDAASDVKTPVLIAAGGPRARGLAAAKADIVTLAVAPTTPRSEHAQLIADVRNKAGARADDLEFAINLAVIGDEVPADIQRWMGADVSALVANDALALLRGTPREMADELLRRRDELGISYVLVNAAFREQLAPVVELLT